MRTVNVNLANSPYSIKIGSGILTRAELYLATMPQRRAAIVTNSTVAALYLERLAQALGAAAVDAISIIVPDGEGHKNWETLNLIYDSMLSNRCERGTTVIALGGGVVGDLAGFAAATYQRGVPLIQVPTTLLSQVDSSVGGKTAINHPLGKNMIGAFYQPRLVVSDLATLSSLPDRELAAGLAEVVKYGLIMDYPFFQWLEANMERLRARDQEALGYAVQRSCENKAEVVAADEKESGQRALLNFGHTFGHAIENGLGYGQWLHGEAVAAGMMMAARLSALLGHLTEADAQRVKSVLTRAGLPTEAPALGQKRYLELMGHDKKVRGGQLRLVLLRSIGQAYVTADFGMPQLSSVLENAAAHV